MSLTTIVGENQYFILKGTYSGKVRAAARMWQLLPELDVLKVPAKFLMKS